jgi:ferredoxin-NADP reductase
MARRELTLIESKPLSPSVIGLTFRTADGAPFAYEAGQWVDLWQTLGGVAIKRAYSIANAPGVPAADRIELAVTRVEGGVMSNALDALTVGSRVEVDGPHGFFTRDAQHAGNAALFVGTGTGLAPLRAMLQLATRQADGPPLILLFGCRTRDDILWRAEIEAWQARCPRLRVEVTLSRPDPAWTGRTGYVQTHLGDVMQGLQRPQVYICGLSHMVQEARRRLKELGFDRKQLQSERYD